MADPLRWASKTILVKTEATYGTDAAPTGANAMLLTNVEFRPMEGQDVSRNLERPYLGGQEQYPAGLNAVLTGTIELVGSGTPGTAPAWSPMARACGLAEVVTAGTNVVYNPISRQHESVTVHFYIDETRHVLLGARGTAELQVETQGFPGLRVTLTGLWRKPTQSPPPAVDFSDFMDPQLATSANTPVSTVNGVTMVTRSANLNFGNDVQPRLLIGSESIIIVDRSEEISMVVEAQPLNLFDPFGLAEARTKVPLVLTHGTTPGYITTLQAPRCQVGRLSGYQNNQGVTEWPLTLRPQPTAGDDQFTITLS
ncbi:hypothetical protein KXS07_23705 [Inquilinus limosus]|uniref:phage tail tube protein n=1 Tax=Inquilinus limosus TaxID=171674 RepID=UPI003F159395